MDVNALSGLQMTLSLVIFSIIAKWYVVPALRRLSLHSALVPLFLVHTLRYLPSTAFAPGQVGADVPVDAMTRIAYGDLASGLLALAAVVFLRYQWSGSISVAWFANLVGSADWLYASFLAASNQLVTHFMGGNWYIIHYYVPLLAVTHVLIFAQLLRRKPG